MRNFWQEDVKNARKVFGCKNDLKNVVSFKPV